MIKSKPETNDGQKHTGGSCQVKEESQVVKALSFSRIATDSIIPFIIIVIANVILIRNVLKSQKDLHSMSESMPKTSSVISYDSTSIIENATLKMTNDTQDQAMAMQKVPKEKRIDQIQVDATSYTSGKISAPDNMDKTNSNQVNDTKYQAVSSNPEKSTSKMAKDTENLTMTSPSDKITSVLDNDTKILAKTDRKIPKAMRDHIAKRKAQRQLAIMVICTSATFICLTLPFPTMMPISIWYDYRESLTAFVNFSIARQCTGLLLAANASINVFVYLVSGTKFRQDFKMLFAGMFRRS